MIDLYGRLVVVTGASSGLGRAIARALVLDGASVVLAARRRERLDELATELEESPPRERNRPPGAPARRAWSCPVDLARPDGPAELMARVREIETEMRTRVFGLVNNAGVTWYGPVTTMTESDLRAILDLNVTATIELTRRFLVHVTDRWARPDDARARDVDAAGPHAGRAGGPDAAILTITSLAAHLPVPYQAAYAASKHALCAYVESVRPELTRIARTGGPRILVTEVAPGGIATEMIEESGLGGSGRSRFLAPPERVACAALLAWRRGRRRAVPGIANRLTVLAGRILPSSLVGRVAERFYRR